ncbi:MAG: TonB C-terminal domain-containing protein [Methylotenera sp.]
MLRTYEKEISWKAGGLALGVHVALLAALLISFNWKAAHPMMNVTEVELWDSIPSNSPSPPVVKIEPPPPSPEPVVKAPPPEPVVKEEVKETPKEEPKVDIALEKKKELEQKKAEEKAAKLAQKQAADKLKKEQLAALQAETRQDDMRDADKQAKDKQAAKEAKDALKKLQQDALAEGDQQALSAKAAANAGVVDEFKSKIQAKIRGNVNKALCGDGNPELRFEIGLLPTGELSNSPKLVKSSGNAACDEAVERAIIASEPLPLPSDASLFSQFRNLKLKFKPND